MSGAKSLKRQEEDAFAREYSKLVAKCVRPFFLTGGDYDDLYQEGMIGLLSAIRAYDPEKPNSFEAFAATCIRHRLYDAIRRDAAARERAKLTKLVLVSEAESSAGEILLDPESEVLANESAKEIQAALHGLLSAFEASVLDPYLDGYTISEIARLQNKPCKSVDNAIRRVRSKLAKHLKGDNRKTCSHITSPTQGKER